MIIECNYCEARVDAVVLAQYEEPDRDWEGPSRVSLLTCPICNQAMLGGQHLMEDGDGFVVFGSASRLWPSPKEHLSWTIPMLVRTSIEEARSCLAARAHTAAVAMSGRALEGICRHFKTKSPYLGGGIEELRDRGIIDSRLFEWSEALHKHRNIAAHAAEEKVSRDNAQDLLSFVESISEYVFVLSTRFEHFKERETKALANKKPVPK